MQLGATMKKSIDDIIFWGIVVVCAILLFGIAWTIVVAAPEPPAYIAWDASQFMVKAKVTRYLNGGSSIEHKYQTLKASKVCNGYISNPPAKTCSFQLNEVDDLLYSYRIREYDAEGRQLRDSLCSPMTTRWQCLPVVK